MNKCKLHYFRSVGKFFVFFEHEIVKRRRNVALAYNGRIPAVRPCVGFERWQFGRMVGYALFTAFILFNFSIPLVLFVNKYDLCFIILLEKVF